jgi:hypothetical protein
MEEFTRSIKYEEFIITPKTVREYQDKDIQYIALHTGGFVKLYTNKTQQYWCLQNEQSHKTPDWKIHFSIKIDDVPKAWNIITKIFIEHKCETGMKTIMYFNMTDDRDYVWDYTFNKWISSSQVGREITLYVPTYCNKYKDSDILSMFSTADKFNKTKFSLKYWLNLVSIIEQELLTNNIATNGIADGDLTINNSYASIRNEAYVLVDGEYIYPPNEHGYNGAGHKNIFKEKSFLDIVWKFSKRLKN